MNTITESEMLDFVKNQAVKSMEIIQSPDKQYRILITLTWKEGDWNVVTTRGKLKEWASLDRLALHITEKFEGILPPINLILSK